MKKIALIAMLSMLLLGATWKQAKRISVADCTYSSKYSEYVDNAIVSWNSARVVKLYLVECGSSADIYVHLENYVSFPPIANTNTTIDRRGNLVRASIQLNASFLESSIPLSESYKQFAVVHELGHAIGLPHNTQKPSVMSTTDGATVFPSSIDYANLRQLYGR